ncbi:hypothetical protein D9615_009682 [Tricholomella constricta]|uniref:Anaphase-promoting complex subunit 4 WD40 domain-containing protein n=1 Tax=Tricholomella constricta TaxID=117010 RepID=A0A8H5LVX4_9AGAR|nr:hypothetical protein D9615_009682 [Tricholomella constricta]
MSTITLSSDTTWLTNSDDREINVMRFSTDGEYLATGDRDGVMLMYESRSWRIVSNYRASTAIRALAWHPVAVKCLVVGRDNGDVSTLDIEAAEDDLMSFSNLIHCVEYNQSGNQLAVAYGTEVYLINDWHAETPGVHLDLTPYAVSPDANPAVPRSLHYISDDRLVVCFMDGYIALYHAMPPYEKIRDFKMRRGAWVIGSSALSPSKTLLAVTNFHDGIDWYSVQKYKWIATTKFDTKEHYSVGIQFIDDESVVVGRSRGGLVLANVMCTKNPERFNLQFKSRTQNLAIGRCNGQLMIAAASKMRERHPLKTDKGSRRSTLHIIYEAPAAGTDRNEAVYTSGVWHWPWILLAIAGFVIHESKVVTAATAPTAATMAAATSTAMAATTATATTTLVITATTTATATTTSTRIIIVTAVPATPESCPPSQIFEMVEPTSTYTVTETLTVTGTATVLARTDAPIEVDLPSDSVPDAWCIDGVWGHRDRTAQDPKGLSNDKILASVGSGYGGSPRSPTATMAVTSPDNYTIA